MKLNDIELSQEQRLQLCEEALREMQSITRHYVGICVNAMCGNARSHPHWDNDYWKGVMLIKNPTIE